MTQSASLDHSMVCQTSIAGNVDGQIPPQPPSFTSAFSAPTGGYAYVYYGKTN